MEKKSVWTHEKHKKEKIFTWAENYIKFISENKTEREVVEKVTGMIPDNDKFLIKNIKGKALVIARPSKEILKKGIRAIAAHIDVPRIDLKPTPLYEKQNIALLKTHYYGGIKKYQWLSIPMALHGVVVTDKGNTKKITIGEKPDEPVFTIPDLLPHLSRKQQEKKIKEFASGEELNVLFGTIPDKEKKGDAVLNKIKKLLNSKYGISEEDLISSELELVPSWKARSTGLDGSMIGGYGHDDRACAYSAVKAILDCKNTEKIPVVVLFDKEEIGSQGNTGADSKIIEDFFLDLLEKSGTDSTYRNLRKIVENTSFISADVNAGIHPTYTDVHDKYNAAKLGYGVVLTKYTGRKGKSGASDAHAEFVAELRSIYNRAGVIWQIGEIGKVDEGGGGTVAKYLAGAGFQVIDSGPPVLAMHSPFEIISKGDLYHTYLGYRAFLES